MALPETHGVLRDLSRPPFAPKSRAPIWQQIADRIRQACADGRLPGDARLPGENQMAGIFGVTRVTVRRALARLQQEGLLQARKGVGVFVRPKPLRYRIDHEQRFVDGLESPYTRIETRTLAISIGRAEPAEAATLGLAEGDPVIRLSRLRLVGGSPIYLARKTLSAALFANFEAGYAPRASVRDVYEAHGISSYRRAVTCITGGFATPHEAQALRLTPETPVLRTVAVNTDSEGGVIEFNHGTWPLTSVELVLRGDGPGATDGITPA